MNELEVRHDQDHNHNHENLNPTTNGKVDRMDSFVSMDRKLSDDKDVEVEDKNLNKLWTVSLICLVFMIIEVIGGYMANSIAIMSDAAHLLSDLLGFIISIVSIYIAKNKANNKMSFGYHRAEVIGALVSVTIIWGLTIWLIYEASYRMINPSYVNGKIMLIVAVLGLIFNLIMGLTLAFEGIDHAMHGHAHDDGAHGDHGHADNHQDHHDHDSHLHLEKDNDLETGLLKGHDNHDDHGHSHDHDHSHENKKEAKGFLDYFKISENVNIRAALIHVFGDALQNFGVIIAGVIIYMRPDLTIVDPFCTFIFAIIVFFSTVRILKECIAVIMEGCPIENVEKLQKRLEKIEGVTEVHDLHVWSLSMGKVSMTCHMKSTNPQLSLAKATELMVNKYKITHTTIQVEDDTNNNDCKQTLH